MKKLLQLLMLMLFCYNLSFAQENIDELKSQLSQQETIIVTQKEEIEYYKKTLNLFNSDLQAESEDVVFKINSVIGDSNSGKVKIEGVLTNNGVTRSLMVYSSQATDPQGNLVQGANMLLGGSQTSIKKLHNDIPTKFSVIFTLTPGTPIIKLVQLIYPSNPVGVYKNKRLEIDFRNIPINWK